MYEIQADRESAFVSKVFNDFFKEEKIVFGEKYRKNKAGIGKNYLLCPLDLSRKVSGLKPKQIALLAVIEAAVITYFHS